MCSDLIRSTRNRLSDIRVSSSLHSLTFPRIEMLFLGLFCKIHRFHVRFDREFFFFLFYTVSQVRSQRRAEEEGKKERSGELSRQECAATRTACARAAR